MFYVLKGHGHDVHDGRHIPWKAGDVMLVENGCVHQHFNDFDRRRGILLVFKAKPLFLFMHLLFQKIVEWPPKIPPKGAEDYKPPTDSDGENHGIDSKIAGPSLSGNKTATSAPTTSKTSQEFRKEYESKPNVVLAEDMPWEHSADGLIKHLVHHKMNTREMCVEAYMQFLKAGENSGKHRHMWEEIIFVAEGSGYDLHWDLKFDCLEAFDWEWAAEPQEVSMEARRLHLHSAVHHPPALRRRPRGMPAHRDANRIIKEMGFDWFDQVENAPGYDAKMKNGGDGSSDSPRHSGASRGAVRMTWTLRVMDSGFAPSARPGMRAVTQAFACPAALRPANRPNTADDINPVAPG